MRFVPKSEIVIDIIARWTQDDELGPLMGGLSLALPLELIKSRLDEIYDGVNNILVGVVDEETNTLGGAYFINILPQHRRADFHLVFLERYRGKFSLNAYEKIIDYMKNQLRLEIVYCMCTVSNTRCSRHLKKMGWKDSGVLPKYFVTSKGQEDVNVFYLELR
jgi:RimJ/RimL family protein N-acetyltransferase